MDNMVTIRDSLDEITVLYYSGCNQGFKFIGDDPEEDKFYIKQEHIDRLFDKYPQFLHAFPQDYLRRFYAHSRCLLFANGVWLSETAGQVHALRYRPGTHLSFRMSGITRFTALTNNASAICVGIDPTAKNIECRQRRVIKVEDSINFTPVSTKSVIIPTEACTYGRAEFLPGSLFYSKNEETVLKFQKPGYIIEYTKEKMDIDSVLDDYANQYFNKKTEVIERTKWTASNEST